MSQSRVAAAATIDSKPDETAFHRVFAALPRRLAAAEG
jgi:hypothetical protein